MAAKKKSTRKKAAKKKVSPKPKKAAKKRAVKKTKKASKPKKSPKAKRISVRKVAGKKKAVKKAKPIGLAIPKGPTIETMEAPAIAVQTITVSARFEIGGRVTVQHSRGQQLLDTQVIPQTGSVTFKDALRSDGLAIDGTCTGSARITTNRTTRPLSDSNNPRLFPEGPITDNLIIR